MGVLKGLSQVEPLLFYCGYQQSVLGGVYLKSLVVDLCGKSEKSRYYHCHKSFSYGKLTQNFLFFP